MNRVLMILRESRADAPADRHLLDRFLAARDEAAFAELVRRYGPVVWGACRRCLNNVQDAEDAFQATFFVLLRRAARLGADVPLGPWLYKVAVMTARNVVRGNRRRAAVTGPMEHEVPAPADGAGAAKLDLDALLLALPERDRAAVVLCHLQGLTRREAAERLGCPEGTLSARLDRALRRLRARFGGAVPAVLAVAAGAVPVHLASATVRAAAVYTTSTLSAAGVSSAVAGLTDGVLRMLWMKKLMTATVAAVLVLGAGVLALGTAGRPDTARATEPGAEGAPPAAPQDPDPLKRVEKLLTDLEKQKQQLDATLDKLKAEKKLLEAAQKDKDAAAALGSDLVLVVARGGDAGRPAYTYTVREAVAGKIGELSSTDLDAVATYLARAYQDPKGPKRLRLQIGRADDQAHKDKVFTACATAGYTKVLISEVVTVVVYTMPQRIAQPVSKEVQRHETRELDLTKFAPKKP